jgi:hypothetical protein
MSHRVLSRTSGPLSWKTSARCVGKLEADITNRITHNPRPLANETNLLCVGECLLYAQSSASAIYRGPSRIYSRCSHLETEKHAATKKKKRRSWVSCRTGACFTRSGTETHLLTYVRWALGACGRSDSVQCHALLQCACLHSWWCCVLEMAATQLCSPHERVKTNNCWTRRTQTRVTAQRFMQSTHNAILPSKALT